MPQRSGSNVAHYNFCRVHEATRVTPAMSLGLTDHPWSIGELLDAALGYEPTQPPVQRRFRVIEGGRGESKWLILNHLLIR
jgi:hypothetical protein